MSRILDFQDGFSSAAEPTQGLVTATSLRVFANDAAFVTFKGSAAADGDMYKNSTDDTVRIFIGGAFQEMVDTTNAQSISGIKTFVNNVIMSGDLTVNGTTTTLNTTNLDVTDKNININDGGNDASSEGAGLNVERTGTDGSFVYQDSLTSKFKIGALAAEVEVADVSSGQTLTNKTIDADNNTVSNLAHGAEVDDLSSGVHGVVGDVLGTTDAQVITLKDIDGGTATDTSRITLPQDTTTNLDALTDKEGTIAYDTTLNVPVFNNGAAFLQIGGSGAFTDALWMRNGNGHGSTNTRIRRFTTVEHDNGSSWTLTQSATLGDFITIDVSGNYLIQYSDKRSGGVHVEGISLNSSQLTTNIESITSADILDLMSNVDERDAKSFWVGPLVATDIIRPHTDATANSADHRCSFKIHRLA